MVVNLDYDLFIQEFQFCLAYDVHIGPIDIHFLISQCLIFSWFKKFEAAFFLKAISLFGINFS